MLSALHIENIALIRRLDLDLGGGFSAFTGETGAGKSILIDAIGLLCGARGEKELIRSGEDYALVEGLFTIPVGDPALEKLNAADALPDEDGTLFVQRRLTSDGRSAVKINGRACPLARLREISPFLIRIHGQQDTAGLADETVQRDLLDAFAGNREEKNAFLASDRDFRSLRRALEEKKRHAAGLEEKKDLLLYQAEELRKAKIRPGEEAELNAEHALLANREKVTELSGAAYKSLYRSERSAVSGIQSAISSLRRLSDVLPDGDEILERLENAKAELTDIAEGLESYAEPGENPADRLQKVENRLDLLASLERKYHTDEAGLAKKLESVELDLADLENASSDFGELQAELENAKIVWKKTASALTESRNKAAAVLAERVGSALAELDMPNVRFLISILPDGNGPDECGPDGPDRVSFLVSANAGEEPKPIAKIASGGELSRIMLCLQAALADAEKTATLIFDEIDTGISGKTNEKIGRMMASIAKETDAQVVCVTHAAQLASRAFNHYRISKSVRDGRAETEIDLLDRDGRVGELSRIMGGMKITDAVRKAAAELLEGGTAP